MKRIFLSSSFNEVSNLLVNFIGEDLKNKTVTFIATASLVETQRFYVNTGRKALKDLGLLIEDLDLTDISEIEIKKIIEKNDFIYISGGNTFFLLQELRRTNANKYIKQHISKGKIYIGESAGSIILSPNIEYAKIMDNETKANINNNYIAMNEIDFYPVPHFGNFPFKNKVKKIIKEYSHISLMAFNNKQAVLINGDNKVIKDA